MKLPTDGDAPAFELHARTIDAAMAQADDGTACRSEPVAPLLCALINDLWAQLDALHDDRA